MTTPPDDWERWRAAWTQPPIGDLNAAARRAVHARRRMRVLAVVEFLIVAAVVSVIVAAVRHAANPFEIVLAVGAAASSIWALAGQIATRRAEARLLAASLADYPGMLMALRRREIGVSRLTMLVVGALLAFLVLWWSAGWTHHRGQAFAPMTIGLFWVPLTGALGLLAWSLRIRKAARRQLEQLSQRDLTDADPRL